MKKRLFILCCAVLSLFFALDLYAENEKRAIADSVLRLHVVAESNSEYDQKIKLKVRDAVLALAEDFFKEAENKDEAVAAALENKALIEKAAKDVLLKEGCFLPLRVEIKKTKFPLKIYGNIKLPGGMYDAVNVKIGKAEGENWWCIMYPALCFSKDVSGVLDSDGEKRLYTELGEEKFRLITDTGDKKIRIKFKILEFF